MPSHPLWRMSRRQTVLGLALVLGSGALRPLPARAAADGRLAFNDLYKAAGVLGMEFSDQVRTLTGKRVVMRGFMAPPLKAEADFFVLTREPVSLCPFCQSDADWPSDIVVVYLGQDQEFVQNNVTIEVAGRLEVGSARDPRTGFVSLLRLVDARFRTV